VVGVVGGVEVGPDVAVGGVVGGACVGVPGSVGAPLGLAGPVAVAVTVVVAVTSLVCVLVTVPSGGFGTVHTTVICWLVPRSVTFGLAVQVARLLFPCVVAAWATATVPAQTRATAARGIRVRLDMKTVSWWVDPHAVWRE